MGRNRISASDVAVDWSDYSSDEASELYMQKVMIYMEKNKIRYRISLYPVLHQL